MPRKVYKNANIIIKEYAILLTAFINLSHCIVDDQNHKTEYWEKRIKELLDRIWIALKPYQARYEKLALEHWNKMMNGIDENTRNKETILPLFAMILLEQYKENFTFKVVGKNLMLEWFHDVLTELIDDIYEKEKPSSKDINETIELAEKIFKKLYKG